jgi:ribosome-associated protein
MDDLHLSDDLVIPAGELEWTFLPSGGPGGQHANRASTKVVLRFDAAASAAFDDTRRAFLLDRLDGPVLSVTVDESRSQWRNRQIARRRLRERLDAALTPPAPPRRPTKPSRRSEQGRLESKRAQSQKKALRKPPDTQD